MFNKMKKSINSITSHHSFISAAEAREFAKFKEEELNQERASKWLEKCEIAIFNAVEEGRYSAEVPAPDASAFGFNSWNTATCKTVSAMVISKLESRGYKATPYRGIIQIEW